MNPQTLIHVFPTTASSQARVLAVLRRMTATAFAPQRGFRGAALAHSVDGDRVVMQSEWNALADFRHALRTPMGVAYWHRVRALLAAGKAAGDVRVYDSMVSFYSLGAVSAPCAPAVHEPSIRSITL